MNMDNNTLQNCAVGGRERNFKVLLHQQLDFCETL